MRNLDFIVSFLMVFVFCTTHAQTSDEKLGKANNYLFENNYSAALELYKELLNEVTDSVDLSHIYSYAGMCSESLGDQDAALDYYRNAVNYKVLEESVYNKVLSLARDKKDTDCQEFVLLKKMEVFPAAKEKALEDLARVYMSSKQYEKLSPLAERLISIDQSNYRYHYMLGISSQGLNKTEEAIAGFKKALALNPDDLGSNLSLGFLLYNQATVQFDKEQKRYEAVSKPVWKDYLVYLDRIKKIQSIYREAEPLLEKACRIKCNDQLEKALSVIRSRTGQIKPAEGLKANE
jgi:tetratricopeptide (TPR) repeat protein